MEQNNIHYHPNNHAPVRFRLQIKEIGIQEYFSFKQFGSEKKALQAAVKRRDEILKIHNLRKSLSFRQIFTEDGFIKGLNYSTTMRRRYIQLSLYNKEEHQKRSQRITERKVTEENFDDVLKELIDMLLDTKKLTLDAQDRAKLKKVRMNYLREFHKLNDRLQEINRKDPPPDYRPGLPPKPDGIFFTEDNLLYGLKIGEEQARECLVFRVFCIGEGRSDRVMIRKITKSRFNDVFQECADFLANYQGYKLTKKDDAQFKKVRQKYRRQFNKLASALPYDFE